MGQSFGGTGCAMEFGIPRPGLTGTRTRCIITRMRETWNTQDLRVDFQKSNWLGGSSPDIFCLLSLRLARRLFAISLLRTKIDSHPTKPKFEVGLLLNARPTVINIPPGWASGYQIYRTCIPRRRMQRMLDFYSFC